MFIPRENPDGFWQTVIENIPFVNSDKFSCNGSYNVIMARFIGLSYPDYLRYCRDKYNAILRGRAGYTYCVYKNKKDCQAVCDELNRQWQIFEQKVM